MEQIKINEFEGPLDLLLHLVESKQLNVLDLKISKIIDDYLKIIEDSKKDQFKLRVEFLQMASILLEIKAFSILKTTKKNIAEENLEKKLAEYKIFKDLSKDFSSKENEYFRAYKKKITEIREREIIEHDYSNLNIESLKEALNRMFFKYNIATENAIKLVLEEPFTVEMATEDIKALNIGVKHNFSTLLRGKYSKLRIVSYFIAILELYKQQIIDIEVEENDIYITREKEYV